MTFTASIIIAAFNAGHCIESAIHSVLHQTESNLEIIVVDDCSTDDTAAKVTRLSQADTRIKLLSHTYNQGPGAARNTGLDHAAGDWVGVLDADDRFVPTRISKLISFGESLKAEIVLDNQYFVENEATRPWRTLFGETTVPARILSVEEFVKSDVVGKSGNFGLLKPLIRREYLDRCAARYPERMRLGEDFCFMMRCFAEHGRVILVSEPLYYYRTGGTSLSGEHRLEALSHMVEENESLELMYFKKGNREIARLLEKRKLRVLEYIEYKKFYSGIKNLRLLYAATIAARCPAVLSIAGGKFLLLPVQTLRLKLAR